MTEEDLSDSQSELCSVSNASQSITISGDCGDGYGALTCLLHPLVRAADPTGPTTREVLPLRAPRPGCSAVLQLNRSYALTEEQHVR